ncbi:MAG: winged helix-turn-helix transcriptional regulator [Rhodobiaceae bacterium]|nr:winged helix-turn-helix transcriptional regulator [Rhodobiaceae bacterium]MCC0054395.1 winged helix-turn-helix transcriptional regulator [Rhodobiaceae bacterium]
MTADTLRDLYCTCCHVRRATRRLTRMYEQALEPSGLTAMQFAILAAVARNPGASRGAVAELLDMDISTLSRGLKPLLGDGSLALALASGEGSGRGAVLDLTPQGRARFELAVPLWQHAQRAVHESLGAAQTRQLHDLLAILPGEPA